MEISRENSLPTERGEKVTSFARECRSGRSGLWNAPRLVKLLKGRSIPVTLKTQQSINSKFYEPNPKSLGGKRRKKKNKKIPEVPGKSTKKYRESQRVVMLAPPRRLVDESIALRGVLLLLTEFPEPSIAKVFSTIVSLTTACSLFSPTKRAAAARREKNR